VITEESKLVWFLIKEHSIEGRKIHLLAISHHINSYRSFCLKRFCRRKGLEEFPEWILNEWFFNDNGPGYFLGTPKKKKS
jgi:hypothetical protein